VNNIVYQKYLRIVDDEMLNMFVLLRELLDDEQHELVMLMKDVLMVLTIYYNDQDKEVYEEINHLSDEDEVQHILSMINIIDDYDFLVKQ
jgi:hypothetical protein